MDYSYPAWSWSFSCFPISIVKMEALIVRVKSENSRTLKYKNKVNAEDFKQVALILFDLSNNGISMDKAIEEYKKLKGSEFPW